MVKMSDDDLIIGPPRPAKDGKKKKGSSSKTRLAPPPVQSAPEEVNEAELPHLVAVAYERVNSLAADIAALRAEMVNSKTSNKASGKRSTEQIPASSTSDTTESGTQSLQEQAQNLYKETGEPTAAVQVSIAMVPDTSTSRTREAAPVLMQFRAEATNNPEVRAEQEGTRNERAARIAASLGAEPRINIARLLLTESALTAAQLGTGAELTTGSLYHHLREMTHAGVLVVVSRNHYSLTNLGRHALLALLALAESNTKG